MRATAHTRRPNLSMFTRKLRNSASKNHWHENNLASRSWPVMDMKNTVSEGKSRCVAASSSNGGTKVGEEMIHDWFQTLVIHNKESKKILWFIVSSCERWRTRAILQIEYWMLFNQQWLLHLTANNCTKGQVVQDIQGRVDGRVGWVFVRTVWDCEWEMCEIVSETKYCEIEIMCAQYCNCEEMANMVR